jgi:hypothetical protein
MISREVKEDRTRMIRLVRRWHRLLDKKDREALQFMLDLINDEPEALKLLRVEDVI